MFLDRAPLTLRLEGDFRALFRDRGAQRKDHPATLRYGTAADTGSIDVKLRTRGIFRLRTCGFPRSGSISPARKSPTRPSPVRTSSKLVTHCQGDRSYERNLLREYALYRVLNALTDTSFRVRLAHMTYIDSARHDTVARYGFLIESDTALAKRIVADQIHSNNVYDPMTDPSYMTLVAVFQYLIGNTDCRSGNGTTSRSFNGRAAPPADRRAVRLRFFRRGERAVRDPPGAAQALLGAPAGVSRVLPADSLLARVLARFRAAKDSMYAAVRAVPDLPERDVRNVLEYFDEFFKVIDIREP